MKLLLRCLATLSVCLYTWVSLGADLHTSGPVVVLGDSLSAAYGLDPQQGWVALLRRRLADAGYGQPVVNASVSGETTSGGRARIARVLGTHAPSVVIVELGANDALRGLPVAQIEDNLVAMVGAIRSAHAAALLVAVPVPGNYGKEYADAVDGAYRNAASRTRVRLVPSLLAGIATVAGNFQADRLHPVAEVQPQMLENVWPALRPMLTSPLRR